MSTKESSEETMLCPHDCERFGGRVPGWVRGSNWDFVPCWCNGTGRVPIEQAQ
jgi:hypothetical protein